MNKINSLKPKGLEQKLYMAYHRDGILDLIVGIMVLLFAAIILFDEGAFIGFIAIPAALYIPFKQKISTPRIGFIQFESEKVQKRNLSLTLVMGLTSLIGLSVFYVFTGSLPESITSLIRDNILLIFGGVIGLVLLGAAFFLNNSRFYGFALLGVVLIWGAHFIGYRLGIAVAILGAIIEVTGIVVLMQFLRDYPEVAMEPEDE